jgi:hypothetical protein
VLAQAVRLLACSIRHAGCATRGPGPPCWRVRSRSSVAPQAFPHGVGLFVPAEGGTGVPFVMALRMPVFLFITAFGA